MAKWTTWLQLILGVLVLLFAFLTTGATLMWGEAIFGLLVAIFAIVDLVQEK